MWLYLCLISTILSGLTSIAMKKCSNNNPISLALIGMVISDITYIILGLITTNVIQTFNIMNLIKIAPLTFIQALGYICGILAVKYACVSTVAPIRKGNTVVTLLLGIIILKDNINLLQLIFSITLIIFTILLAKDNSMEKTNKNEIKGILAAYGFVLLNGTSNFLNKLYINIFHNPLIVVFYYGLMGLILIIVYCFFTNNWKNLNFKQINFKNYFLLHSVLDLGSNLCQRFSLIDGQVSTVSVIHSSSIIITILSSKFILKEKIDKRKYLLISGIIVCVFALAFLK